jgi:hypothetical protein
VSAISLAEQNRAAGDTAREARDQARTLLHSTFLVTISNRQIEPGHRLAREELALRV